MHSLLLLAFSLASQAPIDQPPPAPREFRAVWIATVANIDWPSKPGLPSAQQQNELRRLFDKAAEMNLNAIILQVRPAADALYDSPLEPWSEFLTGTQGKPPSPHWDPLAFAVEEAHKRGIELHAWFNPYRARHSAAKSPVHASHISRTHPSVVKTYGSFLWKDPSEPFVQERTLQVMLDVVKRYNLDGIHIDDYFYPYKSYAKGQDFPDEPSWQRYRASGGTLRRDDWRRKNVDDFVERLYKEIKKAKPHVKFGISPFGVYRPGTPPGITSGVDQYADLYADARKWLVEGWCDYYTPQLYWRINAKQQSYPVLLKWWISQNPKGRHMWPGNFTSQVMSHLGNWPAEEIVNQIQVTRQTPGASGNVHYSMQALSKGHKGLDAILAKGVYQRPALIPASPWLGDKPPLPPDLRVTTADRPLAIVTPKDAGHFIAYYHKVNGRWNLARVVHRSAPGVDILAVSKVKPEAIAVSVVDRFGNESARTVRRL
jgi:uncharacterized lipoprotein YddW (UPF0748 family)